MSEEVGLISNGIASVWSGLLTAGLGYMGYFTKRRDEAITGNDKAITALALKVAENYATKPTVMALFKEATDQTKEAVARVEKSIDSTNTSVAKLDVKIDKVVDSIGSMQSNIMHELSKKT